MQIYAYINLVEMRGGDTSPKLKLSNSQVAYLHDSNPSSFYSSCALPLYCTTLFLLPVVLLPFTPFYAYIFGLFIMVGFSAYIPKNFRILLSITLCLSIALIYASRLYFNLATDSDDDFSRYYQNYLDVYDGLSGAMTLWGGGYEVGLPIFYKLLSILLPKLPPQYVLFCTALFATTLMYIWLEIYGQNFVTDKQKAALIAFSLYIGVFMETLGLTRQALASIFLLYGFFAKPIHIKLLFFIIAASFHLSSIGIIALCYIAYYFPRLTLAVFVAFFIAFIIGASFINTLLVESATFLYKHFPSRIVEYILHYVNANGYNPYYLIYTNIMKSIIMLCIVFTLFVITPNDTLLKRFRVVIVIAFVIYITNIIPGRSMMLVCDTLFCFIIFVVFRHFFHLTLVFFFPYFLKLMYNYLFSGDHPETRAMELFFSYPEASLYPFYYFFQGALL